MSPCCLSRGLRKGLVEHEARDTGGVPRSNSSCPGRLAEATISRNWAAVVGYSKLGRYSE